VCLQQTQSDETESQSLAVNQATPTAESQSPAVNQATPTAESQSPAVNQRAPVHTAVSDRSIQVQFESWSGDRFEELQQLREEVKTLRLKCQRTSGLMRRSPCINTNPITLSSSLKQ